MKTDLEYLNCILSLLDKRRIGVHGYNLLKFEEFFNDWTAIYLNINDTSIIVNRFNHYFIIYCYFFYLNNKELFEDVNQSSCISTMVDCTNKTLKSFKELKRDGFEVSNYIKKDIVSKSKFFIRRIKLKELINEN